MKTCSTSFFGRLCMLLIVTFTLSSHLGAEPLNSSAKATAAAVDYYITHAVSGKYLGMGVDNMNAVDERTKCSVSVSTTEGYFNIQLGKGTTANPAQVNVYCGTSGRFSSNIALHNLQLYQVVTVEGGMITANRVANGTIESAAEYLIVGTKDGANYALTNETYSSGADFRLVGLLVNPSGDLITISNEGSYSPRWKFASANPAPVSYDITVVSNSAAAGSVSMTPASPVLSGAEVTVTAVAKSGYTFVNWTKGVAGTAVSTNAVYTFSAAESVALVANFEVKRYCTSFSPFTHEANRTLNQIISEDAVQNVSFAVVANRAEILNKSMYVNSWKPAVGNNVIKAQVGTTFNLKFRHADTGWVRMFVFADWNQNRAFEFTHGSSEALAVGQELVARNTATYGPSEPWGNGVSAYPVVVPADAPLGQTTIRVIAGWNIGVGACTSENFDNGGNVVDFIIEVLPAPEPRMVTVESSDIAKGSVTLNGSTTELSKEISGTATCVALPKAGYAFVNWTIAGVEVSRAATYLYTNDEVATVVANFIVKQHPADMLTQFTAPTQAGRQKQWAQRYVANAKATVAGADQVLISGVTTNPTPTYNGASTAYMPGALVDMTATKIQIPAGTASFTFYTEGVKSGSNGDGLEWTNQWAFVDWNQNKEYVTLTPSAATSGQDLRMRDGYTRTISIPNGTAAGVYRMYIVYNEAEVSGVSTFFTNLDNGRPQIKNGIGYAFDIQVVADKELTVVPNDAKLGVVSGGGVYSQGTVVTLLAESVAESASFVNWTDVDGTAISTMPIYAYTVNEATTITGNFKTIENLKKVTATSTDISKGSVSTYPKSFRAEYDQAGSIYMVATPAPNCRFVHWVNTADGTEFSTENPLTQTGATGTPDNILALEANFTPIIWNVTLASGANGSAAYTSGITADGDYQQGASITVTATPNEGYAFVNWTNGVEGPALSTDAAYTFTLQQSVNLVANFVEKSYCVPTYPAGRGNGTNSMYVGQITTITTSGAMEDMNWANPKTEDYNGALAPIASGLKTFAGQPISLTLNSKNTAWGFIRIYVDMNNDKEFSAEECIHRDADRNQPTPLTKNFTMGVNAKPGMARIRVFYAGGADAANPACGGMLEGGHYDFDIEIISLDPQVLTYSNPSTGGTFVIKNGEETVASGSEVTPGTLLTVDSTPEKGFKLKKVKVNGVAVSGNTFAMPGSATEVTVEYVAVFPLTFTFSPSGLGTMTVKQNLTPVSSGDEFEADTQLTVTVDLTNPSATLKSVVFNGTTLANLSTFTIAITQASNLEVVAEVPTYTLTYSVSGGGTKRITYVDDTETPLNSGDVINKGQELHILYTPNEGETLVSSMLNGTIDILDEELGYYYEGEAWLAIEGNMDIVTTFTGTGISEASAEQAIVYAADGVIYSSEDFTVYNFASQVVATGLSGEGVSGLSSGIYIVKTATVSVKVGL